MGLSIPWQSLAVIRKSTAGAGTSLCASFLIKPCSHILSCSFNQGDRWMGQGVTWCKASPVLRTTNLHSTNLETCGVRPLSTVHWTWPSRQDYCISAGCCFSEGKICCRGDFGRLGHGDIVDVFIPKPISGLSGVGIITISCGDTHTLALSATGQLYSFGRNQNGQLGTGTDEDSLVPAHVDALKVWTTCFPLFSSLYSQAF